MNAEAAPTKPSAVVCYDAAALMRGATRARINHGGKQYELRITDRGGLILVRIA